MGGERYRVRQSASRGKVGTIPMEVEDLVGEHSIRGVQDQLVREVVPGVARKKRLAVYYVKEEDLKAVGMICYLVLRKKASGRSWVAVEEDVIWWWTLDERSGCRYRPWYRSCCRSTCWMRFMLRLIYDLQLCRIAARKLLEPCSV